MRSRRVQIPLVAAASFVAGFGVADATGVRALGGVVLLAGGAWCAREALPLAGPRATGGLVGVALALFVISHVLGRQIGAWPAVFVCADAVAVAAALLLRPRAPVAAV